MVEALSEKSLSYFILRNISIIVLDSNLLAGKGAIYSFDPVGSYEREKYRAEGSSSAMLQPFLDNQVCGTSL